MPGLFNQVVPGSTPAAGSSDYQSRIVGDTATMLRPYYQKSLRQGSQDLAGRGLLGHGGAEAEMRGGLRQDYLGQVGHVANQAAISGADLAEHNRQREEERGWSVQDMERSLAQRNKELDAEAERSNADRWASILASGIGGAANLGGNLLGRFLFKMPPPGMPSPAAG